MIRSDENENILEKEKKAVVASLPIRCTEDIELIKDLYIKKNQVRELLMFTPAGNTGLGLLELLNIKVKDGKGKQFDSPGVFHNFKINLRFREGMCL